MTGARKSYFAIATLGVALAGCSADSLTDPFTSGVLLAGTTTSLQVSVEARTRQYLVHEPVVSATKSAPIPLVIVLHGSDQQGADIRTITGMDSLSEARRFVVAYPNGLGSPTDWNAGQCCGPAHDNGVDDIAFLKAIISDLSARLPIDPSRIYVAGFSDGGRMAYRAACEMSDQIAAVAVVSGSLVTRDCAPSRSTFVIAFHGTADPSVSYREASATPLPRAAPQSAAGLPPAVQFWMAENSCTGASEALVGPHTVRTIASGCSADVVFYEIVGGAHAWPTVADGYEISASPVIADFFAAHRLAN
jgi:polyhydroxybutyrate depolymerase